MNEKVTEEGKTDHLCSDKIVFLLTGLFVILASSGIRLINNTISSALLKPLSNTRISVHECRLAHMAIIKTFSNYNSNSLKGEFQ